MRDAAEVRLDGVGKRYGDLWAVRDVSFRVVRGAFYTLLGPSGCGKTTLLRIVAGFVQPDAGGIWLDDRRIDAVPPWRRGVGLVFQNYALWPHLTVFENVAFGLRERRVPGPALRARVAGVLEQVGLAGLGGRRPGQLSGGQQQRVALARTLVVEPRILLLDEPLSNLDAQLRAQMRVELARLQREVGITTIYVTHDQAEALALSTRVAVLSGGVVVQEGTPWEVYHRPRTRFVAEFIGAANILAGRVADPSADGPRVVLDGGAVLHLASVGAGDAAPAPGSPVIVCVRPEAVRLVPGSAPASSVNALPGRVRSAVFEGSRVRCEVEVGAGLTVRADVPSAPTHAPPPPGAAVSACFDAADTWLLA
jgi:ABC-type Fe3+/spermidine/putrescine transport system ATPase subunit